MPHARHDGLPRIYMYYYEEFETPLCICIRLPVRKVVLASDFEKKISLPQPVERPAVLQIPAVRPR